MWQEWSDRLVARAEADNVPRAEALQGLRALTNLLLAYQDHVASQVAESFARANDMLSRSRAHVRNALVRQLLRDDAVPLSPSDLVILDYPLAAIHVAVLLPTVAEGAAGQVLHGLRAASNAREALIHSMDLSSSVIWLAQPSGWSAGALDGLAECLTRLDVQASLSEARSGPVGFRAAWQQVQDIERIRGAWGAAHSPRVLRHGDVSLEILLMQDPERAREFVASELGPLADSTEQSARLRETLEASFRWGSHVTTAEHLHLHEHTVRNRLLRAGELLGHPLKVRRTELQVALRLSRLLEAPDRA
jgi:DNA-binding PucR family transcriptional regulator